MEDDNSILSNSKNNSPINEPEKLTNQEKAEIDVVEAVQLVAGDGCEVEQINEIEADGGETDFPGSKEGDEASVAGNLTVEELLEDSKVGLDEAVVVEENVSTETEQMTTMNEGKDEVIKVEVISAAQGKMEMDEGSKSEDDTMLSDGVGGDEAMEVAKDEKGEEEEVMKGNLVDVSGKEKPKEVELMELDVSKNDEVKGVIGGNSLSGDDMLDGEKDVGTNVEEGRDSEDVGKEVIEVAKGEKDEVMKGSLVDVSGKEKEKEVELMESDVSNNDEVKDLKGGNSLSGDDMLDGEKDVGINVEEGRDSKDVGKDAIEVAKAEEDENEDEAMKGKLVDVLGKEKEKEVELMESDVSKNEEVNDVIGGNSLSGDDMLDGEKDVGTNVEEGRDSEDVGKEVIEVAKGEKDEVMKGSLVDVSGKEKEKEVELMESDVSNNDEVKDLKGGNSLSGDDMLDGEKDVGINVEEGRDSKDVGKEAIEVAKAEEDENEDEAMKGKLVDVLGKEKEKEVELMESDVSKNEEVNDVIGGNRFSEDDMLDGEKDVGVNVEEGGEFKEVDSESTVSESFVDKSGKDDEVEGADNTEADTMAIAKDGEPDVTGDSDECQTPGDEEMVAKEEANGDTEVETETDAGESGKASGGKRKRGKNSNTSKTKSIPKARKTVEEDVCYICYDGGDLVLCDRRGCPKAYHTYCVNRDEAFFLGKGRWNCGWHLCSICEKNAHYFCYTCPFSLCKGCIKDAVILCVRAKKGFCETCIKTVKLIESIEQGVENDQVDFDDKGSWECLFRDYFMELKSKLSLSSSEIAEAKSPWKGLDTSAGKDDKGRSGLQGNIDVTQESPEPPLDPKDDDELDANNFNENEEASKPRRKKLKKRLKKRGEGQNSPGAGKAISNKNGPIDTEWASKELLEFVMHMKSGDGSILSEYDVQALLLEYIKRNNLRDPRQRSRIICDSRLQNLFGKPRVAHFEMLKLLESHIFVKEDAHRDDVQGSVVDTNSEQLEVDGNADTPKGIKEKKRRSRKKGYRGPQSNLDDYAAIDMHNISLIYLRRKLMEDLLEDTETFQDKVTGTFVRIRISGSVQKQELYRLVQVIGTSNAADPYKVGKRSTNVMVEILNLNKTEVIQIDTLSNQDFTEDECKRLRQSIKCGLINRLTVGDMLDKATELQAAKVNDWLETEVVRLTHLRDRASETGRKKELRECVEKILLLKTPEERQRRLDESPDIHADPKMDPNYESENDIDVDENRQDANSKIGGLGSRGGRGQISPGSDTFSKDPWSRGAKYSSRNWELDRNLSSKNLLNKGSDNPTHFREVQGETSWNRERDRSKPEPSNLHRFGSNLGSVPLGGNSHDVPKSESLSLSVPKPAPALAEAAESTKIIESEKNWHYKDPSGKVQGPFSIVQLRKWSNTGYFPAGLTVWRMTEKQEDSILLADALSGKFLKESTAAASALPSSLSANLTSIMASLAHAREHQDRDKLRSDLDASGNLTSHIVSPGQAVPSVEHPKLSAEKWSQTGSSSFPSPTPILNNAGFVREGGSLSSATSYIGRNSVLPSPTAVSSEYQGHSSTPTSALSSDVSNTFPNLQTVGNTEVPSMQVHGNVAVAQSHIVDANAATSVQPQNQAHGQWGNAPATGYMNPGNFAQGNQPNMQLPALHNTSWAAGMPENNTITPGPRPENSNLNIGWGGMQGNQSTVWMGVPHMNANVNWGAGPLPGPPPANQNMGWTMPPGNLGAAVQGQLPAGANPVWTAGTGNPPVPGVPPAGNVNQSWAPPQSGNVPSNVHMPASGRGWSPAPSDQGANVPGNVNQGLNTPPRNQGPYGADQNHSGGKFSSQRDQGSRGGNFGYEGDRSRNRPPSFGNGGPGGPRYSTRHHDMKCPYNQGGRCRKGTACNYSHT